MFRKHSFFLLVSFCLLHTSGLYAQWDHILSTTVKFGYTLQNPDIQAIAIGKFDANPFLGFNNTPPNGPRARLHISDFFMTYLNPLNGDTADYFPSGALFRTAGNRNIENNWRMFTGDDHPTATEKGRLFVSAWDGAAPPNANQSGKEFNVQSSEGHLLLNSSGFSTNPSMNGIRNRVRVGSFDWISSTINIENVTGVGITAGSQYTTANSLFPIINPQAILHLGTEPPTGSGFRDWMRMGTLTTFNTDVTFFGLRFRDYDADDAVIAWGDNQFVQGAISDPLCFTFTGSAASPAPANSNDGLEVGRITVHVGASGQNTNARWGIGSEWTQSIYPKRAFDVQDPTGPQLRLSFDVNPGGSQVRGIYTDFEATSAGDLIISPRNNPTTSSNVPRFVGINTVSTSPPTNDLDVNGTARIRVLNNSTGTVVVADANGVLYKDPNFAAATITADNGLNMSTTTNVQLGGALILNTEVSQNTHHLVFSNATGNFGIGRHFDGLTNLPANRFEVYNGSSPLNINGTTQNGAYVQTYFNAVPTFPGGAFTTAGSFLNSTTTPVGYVYRAIGVRGEAQLSCSENLGIYGLAITPAQGTPKNYGVYGEASGGITNYGVYGKSLLPTTNNYGVYGEALNGVFNYGVYAKCATFAPTHWALYCDGRGFIPGGFWTASDSKLKNNITVLAPEEAINLIKQFSPKKYEFNSTDYPSFNFPTGEQYGIMADELESILPQFVTDAVHPSVQDSTGNEIYPAVSFKAVNYQALVPILIQGVKDQQAQIEAQQAQIASLTASLNEIKKLLKL